MQLVIIIILFLFGENGQAFILMEDRVRNEAFGGHLSTSLAGLDNALCGGIPFGVLTELVGPSGIGKTQVSFQSIYFCYFCAYICRKILEMRFILSVPSSSATPKLRNCIED